MTSSNNISAAASGPSATAAPRSQPRPPSPTNNEQYALTGPSNDPDPRTHAYRKDLADAALAGVVIASHYAEPVERHLERPADLLVLPQEGAETIAALGAGELFLMLDDSLGWAWGYGGDDRLVGYLPSGALTP